MNIVLICLDTFRADCLAAAGRNPVIQTPNLDRLAREGVIFDNAFGEGQPTVQFRRALLTGQRSFPWRYDLDNKGLWPGGHGWHKILPGQPTLPEIFLEHGWATGMVSDTYHLFKPTANFTRGMAAWDFIRGQETDNYRSGSLSEVDLSKYCKPGYKPSRQLIQHVLNNQGRDTEDNHISAQVFSSAIGYLDDNQKNNPFFLWIDAFDPHEPWDPPTKYADLYDPDWDEDWEPIHIVHSDAEEKIQRRVRALYYGLCTFADKQVGRLLDALERLSLMDDTLILAMSDHGTEVWDHGYVHKGHNSCRYRHNSEILFVAWFPGKEHSGKRVSALVQNQDVAPTLLSLAGIECPPIDGVNLMPLLTGEMDRVRDFAISGWSERASVRTLDYNYSCDYVDPSLNEHLFDLNSDPQEMVNLSAELPEICCEYRDQLEEFFGEKLPREKPPKGIYFGPPSEKCWQKASWAESIREQLRTLDT